MYSYFEYAFHLLNLIAGPRQTMFQCAEGGAGMKNSGTMDGWRSAAVAGAAAGFVATAVKTAYLISRYRKLPLRSRYPLPPGEIVAELGRKARLHPTEAEHQAATLLAHFSYGTTAGALYGVTRQHLPLPPVAAGMAYGAAVWAGSYFVMLPALRLLRSAGDHPPARSRLMLAGHLVWGTALGWLYEETSRPRSLRATPAILAGKPERYPDQPSRRR
jgi:uncharacterized membrane protein YagU involved in acid resistance